MKNTLVAPDLTPGYPSRGRRVGPAWADAWSELVKLPGEWIDGPGLWTEVAQRHGLHPDSVRGLLFRMASAGILERERSQVVTERGKRYHTHFRYVSKEG